MTQAQFFYITNPQDEWFGIGAFRIHYHTNAGYTTQFAGEWRTIPAKDCKALPNEMEAAQ